MGNFSRSTWATILFIGLFAPIALYLLMTFAPLATRSSMGPAASQPQTLPASASGTLLAAGDGKTLWLVQPVLLVDKDKKSPNYALLLRTSNTGTWTVLRNDDHVVFGGSPRGIAVIPTGTKSESYAYVITDTGVTKFETERNRPADQLPPEHKFLAVTGSSEGVFALTSGSAHPSTTRSGDRLVTTSAPATSRPSPFVSSAPATRAATLPVEAVSVRGPALVNAYWLQDTHWIMLPALGPVAATSTREAPGPAAQIALAQQSGRLIALWIDSADPQTLIARSLDYRSAGAKWSDPVVTHLPEAIPPETQLLPVTIDGNVYLFWPVAGVNQIALHGGRLTDLTLPQRNFLPPLMLGALPASFNPATDVALGPAENSFVVVVGTDQSLIAHVFNSRGQETGKPVSVQPQSRKNPEQVVENLMFLLIVVVTSLAIWQWRQRPRLMVLPDNMVTAPLRLRAFGFVVDFVLAMLLTAAIFGKWDVSAWNTIFEVWVNAFTQPEELFVTPEVPTLLGIYLLHVTAGELFFRRSIGKALMGTQVLMLDGAAPTVAAIFLRNLMRIPEMIPGLLSIYVLLSANRQRIGDLLASTLVVSPKPPETPEDPDRESK